MNNIRQGDVFLKVVESLPEGAIKAASDPVLMHGESGNSHRLVGTDWSLYTVGGDRYLHVYKPTTLIHEEHDKHIIAPGVYQHVQERSYDYIEEETKAVVD